MRWLAGVLDWWGDAVGKRGPKPKRADLKALAGNPGKRPLIPADGSRRRARLRRGRPDRPRELDGEAGREWDRVCADLDESGNLAVADRGILAAYCLAVADMLAARAEISRAGRWIQQPMQSAKGELIGEKTIEHPAVKLLDRASTRVGKLAEQLGLSPASRHRQEDAESPQPAAGNKVVELRERIAANRERGTA